MTRQTLRLGKYWKLFPATLNYAHKSFLKGVGVMQCMWCFESPVSYYNRDNIEIYIFVICKLLAFQWYIVCLGFDQNQDCDMFQAEPCINTAKMTGTNRFNLVPRAFPFQFLREKSHPGNEVKKPPPRWDPQKWVKGVRIRPFGMKSRCTQNLNVSMANVVC